MSSVRSFFFIFLSLFTLTSCISSSWQELIEKESQEVITQSKEIFDLNSCESNPFKNNYLFLDSKESVQSKECKYITPTCEIFEDYGFSITDKENCTLSTTKTTINKIFLNNKEVTTLESNSKLFKWYLYCLKYADDISYIGRNTSKHFELTKISMNDNSNLFTCEIKQLGKEKKEITLEVEKSYLK